jgi:hypothetical protein
MADCEAEVRQRVTFGPAIRKVALFALQVLEAKDGRIRVIDHFMSAPSHAALFASGLARTLPR